MNLICITESELAQWVSRRNFDTISARVIREQEAVTREIFSTGPFLKLEDARGRIVVNLKDDWKDLSQTITSIQNIEVLSIPVEAISEIAPTMDQYAKRLEIYKLPIATWSVEKVWDEWLIAQAVNETYRATTLEVTKIGCIDKETICNENFVKALIQKSFRPNIVSSDELVLMGWKIVLERRDEWIQTLRMNGHLDNTSMLNASVELIINSLSSKQSLPRLQISDEERGWQFQDITVDILQKISVHDFEIAQLTFTTPPPLFCIAVYLRLYDEIHNGNKDWKAVFNLLRFTKYSVSSFDADVILIALVASLKTEEIYTLGLRDLYMR